MHLKLSQIEMSEKVGLSEKAWQSYELGKSTPGSKVYLHIQELGFSVDWLLSGIGTMLLADGAAVESLHSRLYVKLRPLHNAGDRIPDKMLFNAEWLRGTVYHDLDKLSVFVVSGNTMSPSVDNGDVLIVNTAKNYFSGDGIYLLSLNASYFVKRVQALFDGTYRIFTDNEEYSSQVLQQSDLLKIMFAGRLVWIGKKI